MSRVGGGTLLAALMLAVLMAGGSATVAEASNKISKSQVREYCTKESPTATEYYESKDGGYGCRFNDGTSLDCQQDQTCKFNEAKSSEQTADTNPGRAAARGAGQVADSSGSVVYDDETRSP